MKLALAFVTVLCTLTSVLAATCPANVCDVGYGQRLADTRSALDAYYGADQSALAAGTSSDGYAAALYYLSQGNDAGNQILRGQLTRAVPSAVDGVYLSWALREEAVADDVRASGQARLASLPQARGQQDQFLNDVTRYLLTDNKGSLENTLRNVGRVGWGEIDQHPTEQAQVVVGLLALYDTAADPIIQKLAEMNLDIIFARFAAGSVSGAWVMPRSGQSISAGAYDREASPWYGWSSLLLQPLTPLTATEPSLVVAGYCAHNAIRVLEREPRSIRETANGAYLAAYAQPGMALAGTIDINGRPYIPPAGYATKAHAHLGTSPEGYIELSTRTSDELTTVDQPVTERVAIMDERVLLADLNGNACKESHALIGPALEVLQFSDGAVVGGEGHFALITVAGSASTALAQERYPVRVTKEPAIADAVALYDTTGSGLFALEHVPEMLVFLCGGDLGCISTTADTRIVKNGNAIEYRSDLSGSWHTYSFVPDQQASEWDPQKLATFGSRAIYKDFVTTEQIMDRTGSIVTLTTSDGGRISRATLDFGAATPDAMKTSGAVDYGCGQPALPELSAAPDGMGFALATFRQQLEGKEHIIDCAQGTAVLPNNAIDPDGSLVDGACVILGEGKRSVAIAYARSFEEGEEPPLRRTLARANTYFPFAYGLGLQVQADKCDSAATATAATNEFRSCGEIAAVSGTKGLRGHPKLYAWANGKHGVLVVSETSNPFSAGVWSAAGNWLQNLFGAAVVEGAAGDEAFKAAYLYNHRSGRKVTGLLGKDGNGLINISNFRTSLAPLAQGYSYRAGGNTQLIGLYDPNPGVGSSWGLLTRALRVNTSVPGSPMNFQATCGGTSVGYIPECSSPNGDAGRCTVGNTNRNLRCDSNCMIDDSPCYECNDQDGDGYLPAGCTGQVDCRDFVPAGSCVGIVPGSSACDSPPLSRCPQCVHPGAGDPCDGIDNDCSGGEPRTCAGTPGSTYTCDNPLPGCGFVCETASAPEQEILVDAKIILEPGTCSFFGSGYRLLSSQPSDGTRDRCRSAVRLCGLFKRPSELSVSESAIRDLRFSMDNLVSCPPLGSPGIWTTTSVAQRTDCGSGDPICDQMRLCVQTSPVSDMQPDDFITAAMIKLLGAGTNAADRAKQCPLPGEEKTSGDWYGNSDVCVGYYAMCVQHAS